MAYTIKRAGIIKFLALNTFLKDRITIKNNTGVDQEIFCLVIEKEIRKENIFPKSFHVLNDKEMTIDCVIRKLYHKKIIKAGKKIRINCKYDTIVWGTACIQNYLAFDVITLNKKPEILTEESVEELDYDSDDESDEESSEDSVEDI